MIIEGKDIHSGVREDVDVCVVGSGAGGAIVARGLAEKGLSVVVLEDGGYYPTSAFRGDIRDAFSTLYRNQGADTTIGIPAIMVPTGKCLGGTTVINMGTSFRAPDRVLESWRAQGLEGYGPEAMAPYYDRAEKMMSVQEVKPDIMGRGGEVIAEGARKLGLHPKPIRRNVSDGCHGCGNCAYGCMEDAKQSMMVKMIPAASEAGAKFYCDTRAHGIYGDKEMVTGVTARVCDRRTGVFCHNVDVSAKVVVLAAGALNTPALLLKNRVANRSGAVGRHLKLHLCSRAIGVFPEIIDSFRGVCQNLYIDDYVDQGIMFEATFTGPATQLAGCLGVGRKMWEVAKSYRHMASIGIMISEKSEGRVKTDGEGRPSMYFSVGQEDVDTLHRAMIIADRILFMAGAEKVLNSNFAVPEVEKMTDLDALAAIKPKAGDFGLMAFHPMGTCRMGVNPKKSVVGPDGKTHDLQNLYIADASVFPTSLGVNPQETIWAVALRVVENIASNEFGK